MKKVFLTLLAMIVIVGALIGTGYWGYRIGYVDSATGSDGGPFFGRSYHMNPNQMPFHRYDRGFGFDQHPMMRPGGYHSLGMGFGYFSPLRILWNIAILALIVWFAYWLFTKSGWQITRKVEIAQNTDSPGPAGN
ncbi:MAG TPA: hypothetical protein VK851_15665 [Anaerolineales bacterium]|nr:hypothetical protein [Anaerolineales bacterium]